MSEWNKARKKPKEIEYREPKGEKEEIDTREGTVVAEKGDDYVIRGVEGELYPIGKEIFRKSYEKISEERTHNISTAHVELENDQEGVEPDDHMIAISEVYEDDEGLWIVIPDEFVDLEYLNIAEKEVEIYHNDDNFVSMGASSGQGVSKVEVKHEENTYYLKVDDSMDAIKPLDNTKNFPVLFLSCGEFWIVRNNDLWTKLSDSEEKPRYPFETSEEEELVVKDFDTGLEAIKNQLSDMMGSLVVDDPEELKFRRLEFGFEANGMIIENAVEHDSWPEEEEEGNGGDKE